MTQDEARKVFAAGAREKYPGLEIIIIANLGKTTIGGKEYPMFALESQNYIPMNIGVVAETADGESAVFWNDTPELFAKSAKQEFGENATVKFAGWDEVDETGENKSPTYNAFVNGKTVGLGCSVEGVPVWWHCGKGAEG